MSSSKKQKVLPDWERNVQACTKALKSLMKNPAAGAFLMPVDWKALKLPTYPKIVKNPMDLGTVLQKLEASRYAKVEDFASDVQLVWKNAKAFNLEGSDIYEVAVILERIPGEARGDERPAARGRQQGGWRWAEQRRRHARWRGAHQVQGGGA